MTKTDEKELRELVQLHQRVEHVEALAKGAKAILRERLPDYARLHYEAATEAARRGDGRPAEFMLSNLKAMDDAPPIVEPAAKRPEGGNIRVLIGVQLGGLPPGATAGTQVIEAQVSPSDDGDAEGER
jgi:hypothetical protein